MQQSDTLKRRKQDTVLPRLAAQNVSAPTGAQPVRRVRRRRDETGERSRRYLPLVWSLLLLAACLASLGAAGAGVFRVREVRVVGANLPAEAIVQATGVMGQNIFTVRSDLVVSRLSRVREIVVQRVDTSFPDTVTIHARLRQSLVAWQIGHALYELDPDGRIIRQVQSTRLPVIVGTDTTGALGPGVVEAVRYAVGALPAAPNGAIAIFQFQPHIGLVIVGRSGWTADIGTGSPQTLVNRIATLVSALAAIRAEKRQLEFIDLRYRVPYARFRGA